MNYLFVLWIGLIVLCAQSFIMSGRDVFAPSVIFTGVFVISTSFTLANYQNWDIDYSWKSCAIILFGNFIYVISEKIVSSIKKTVPVSSINSNGNCDFTPLTVQPCVVLVFSIFSVVSIFLYYLEINRIVSDFGINGMSSLAAFKDLAAAGKISENGVNFWVSQMLKITEASGFVFLYVILQNRFLASQNTTNSLIFVPVFCLVAYCILASNRYQILSIVVFILISSYILRNQKYNWTRNISSQYIRIGLITISIALPLFYFSISLIGRITEKSMFEYISLYAGGSIQHFNQYVQSPTEASSTWGEETFVGLHTILWKLGFIPEQPIIHLEFRQLNWKMKGNVYTFFRRPLHDFGFLGMIVFVAFISMIFGIVYFKKIKYITNSFENNFWVLLYSFFFPWIAMASIEQYAASYLSVNRFITIALIWIIYNIILRFRISRNGVIYWKKVKH